MPHLNPKSRYHVRPGLKAILDEAHVSGVQFYENAGISHAPYQIICKGSPFVGVFIREKVIYGVAATCGNQYRARAESLWAEVPQAEVKVFCRFAPLTSVDKQVYTWLRALAHKHGLTPFEYIAKLVEVPRDPLELLTTKRRSAGLE